MNALLSTVAVALLLGASQSAPPQGEPAPAAAPKPAAAQAERAKRVSAGEAAPDFTVKGLDGKERKLVDLRGDKKDKILVLSFWSHTCPWSRGWDAELSKIAKDYASKNVVIVGIDSNKAGNSDGGKNTDSAEDVARYRKETSLAFEVFLDPQSTVANLFGGQTTPDVFVIGVDGKVHYTGRVDDMEKPGGEKVEKHYLRSALDAIVAGKPVAEANTKPAGCSIKRAKIGS